ncbi:hypothetical protein [Scytonema sp. PRP1]|uniref:hypothetical protein n=1 Tax=Scytonema sp. PRP1 TaxID=3120513 RepID=UPI00300CF9B3
MSKRLIGVSTMLTVSALNLAATLPVVAETDLQPSQAVDSSNFQRPNNAKVDNSPLKVTPAPEVNVNASQVRVIKQAPVKFQAFELKDPETGKQISADTILTLPDGKKVKAGEYYAELNRLEQQFNQLGYSLRSPEEKVTLQESVVDSSSLQKQVEAIKKQQQPVDSVQPKIREFLEPNKVLNFIKQQPDFQTELTPDKTNPSELQNSPSKQIKTDPVIKLKVPSNTKTVVKTWNLDVGKPSTFSAYLNGKLELKGSTSSSSAYAEGNAGGYIFNQRANLLRATANLNAPASGKLTTDVNLLVLGQNFYNFQDARQGSLRLGDTYSRTIDAPIADARFFVGPIPMRAKFGVQGSAGFTYNLIASPKLAYARVNPFLDSKAYGQGGADIVVGGAGVSANLTLLKDNLDIYSLAYLGIESGKPYLYAYYSGYNQIEALNGNAYAFAYIYVPKLRIPPWKKKQWNWNIFSWDGLKYSGYLFNGSEKIYF